MPPARVTLYVATAGALALMGRSILLGPVPLWISAVALGGYLALVFTGVLVLRLEMFIDVLWRGPDDARGVALTFEDGPSPATTPRVLDLLDEAGVKATFFVVGWKAKAHPAVVRMIVERGHALGVHGYTHDRLFALRAPESLRLDVARAIEATEAAAGVAPSLFRPPIGHSSPRIARALEAFELTVVGWSVRGRGKGPDEVAKSVVPRLRDGAIVLLHDAAEDDDHEPASLGALPRILDAMRSQNLVGVRVDEWISVAK